MNDSSLQIFNHQDKLELEKKAFALALGVLLGHPLDQSHECPLTKSRATLTNSSSAVQEATVALDMINYLLREMRSEMKLKPLSDPLKPRHHYAFSETYEASIAKAVWLHWNSSLGISHKLKATIQNLIEASAAFNPRALDRPAVKTLLSCIREAVWIEKRTFGVLLYLLPILTVEETLEGVGDHVQNQHQLLSTVLHAIGDDKLASVSGQVAIRWTLMIMSWDHSPRVISPPQPTMIDRDQIWIQISMSILLCEDERKRRYFCQYYLLALFKHRPDCFIHLCHELKGWKKDQAQPVSTDAPQLPALIALACAGRSVEGVIQQKCKLENQEPPKLINDSTLSVCLSHPSTYLRSSALYLICQSNSSAALVPSAHLSLLFDFFRWNLGEIDPELKQNIKSNLANLLGRLRDSSHSAQKKLNDLRVKACRLQPSLHSTSDHSPNLEITSIESFMNQYETYLQEVKRLVIDLKELWIANSSLCSPYRIQIASLGYLKMLLDTGIDPSYQISNELPSGTKAQPIEKVKNVQTKSRFPFELQILDSNLVKVLVSSLNSTYDDIRTLSFTLLRSCPTPLPGFETHQDFDREIVEVGILLSGSKRAGETCTGTLLLRLVLEKHIMSPSSGRVPFGLLPQSDRFKQSENPLGKELFFWVGCFLRLCFFL